MKNTTNTNTNAKNANKAQTVAKLNAAAAVFGLPPMASEKMTVAQLEALAATYCAMGKAKAQNAAATPVAPAAVVPPVVVPPAPIVPPVAPSGDAAQPAQRKGTPLRRIKGKKDFVALLASLKAQGFTDSEIDIKPCTLWVLINKNDKRAAWLKAQGFKPNRKPRANGRHDGYFAKPEKGKVMDFTRWVK